MHATVKLVRDVHGENSLCGANILLAVVEINGKSFIILSVEQYSLDTQLTIIWNTLSRELPYSGKLSREKTFADLWEVRISHRKLSRIA